MEESVIPCAGSVGDATRRGVCAQWQDSRSRRKQADWCVRDALQSDDQMATQDTRRQQPLSSRAKRLLKAGSEEDGGEWGGEGRKEERGDVKYGFPCFVPAWRV